MAENPMGNYSMPICFRNSSQYSVLLGSSFFFLSFSTGGCPEFFSPDLLRLRDLFLCFFFTIFRHLLRRSSSLPSGPDPSLSLPRRRFLPLSFLRFSLLCFFRSRSTFPLGRPPSLPACASSSPDSNCGSPPASPATSWSNFSSSSWSSSSSKGLTLGSNLPSSSKTSLFCSLG